MVANILSGTQTAKEVREALKAEVADLKAKHPGFQPKLVIVQVGGREDSNVYIRQKLKAAAEVGVDSEHVKYPREVSEAELLSGVQKLNSDPRVHGIIIQLPLDSIAKIDGGKICNAVCPLKDVDGVHIENAGRLSHGELEGFFLPCTPRGCLELIQKTGIEISGKNAVVIGRSKIVGSPMACILRNVNATVTMCHSRTKDVPYWTRQADIIVAGVGVPRLVKRDWVKPGAIVIDCGINSIQDPTSPKGSRLVGDVDYDEVKEVASWITPVPGGVGPMTVAMLIKNTVISAKREVVGTVKNF
ncbi:C-1-tetrahydrofolate synthase, cytoplasmic-like [Varroa jacobsoni]|uniref:C-1-tetrahydrofolate synthase, cytoplasmic n=1 Tax=Varroa destructor TaxID=109461 RepID=A0A7M7K3G2_VARDE|nr:C-1-tetrahydrofolate synthase, cytoplasmic-like [Varroa destructor]XP_022659831.1 C-1-tetrahydrofolate synthase, cytoplasmic-like [Varroa destructor]XP_022699765.1 C-1-tetrahydrofolate synthase, cytoplasmic-like [Varroa jacobsoni]XP_022699766.1 C-1-tetrahydrofolate synthase, cytoplasmic-like [Varroa jacobsoni]XP_022699767.1 C-1-tetrahydrofolate synthase, cytoplasmic-like [Varroa jacobsoni]